MAVETKRRKHLTRKQLKYFGTKRQKAAAGIGARRKRSGIRTDSRNVLTRYGKKATTRRTTKSKAKSTGRPSWVNPVIWAAIGLAAITAGIAVSKWVNDRGGWTALKAAYDSNGISGLLSFATHPLALPSPTQQTGTITPDQHQAILDWMNTMDPTTGRPYTSEPPVMIGPPDLSTKIVQDMNGQYVDGQFQILDPATGKPFPPVNTIANGGFWASPEYWAANP